MMTPLAEHSNGVTDYEEGLIESDDTAVAASDDDKAPSLFADANALLRTVVSGGGFLADAYDLFVVNLVIVVLTFDQSVSAGDKSLIATAVLVGSIIGQLSFGYIADVSGRRIAFIITVALLIVGSTLSALAVPIGAVSLFLVLAAARFVLGVGVGGEYPLSATVSSEATTNIRGRGARVAAVFSMQGVGALLAPCVVLDTRISVSPGIDGTDMAVRVRLRRGAASGDCIFPMENEGNGRIQARSRRGAGENAHVAASAACIATDGR